MKTIIISFILLQMIFLFTSCQRAAPTESIPFTKGEYSGTFSVTFKRYHNSYPITQEGKITIIFYDSTYDYSASVDLSSNNTTSALLTDNGVYSKTEDKITMNDDSWLRMDAAWHNSLYLFDKFTVHSFFNQIEISQENNFANWKLNLSPRNN